MAGSFLDSTTDQRQRVVIAWEENSSEVVEFDAVITENHLSASEITDHPVESGVDFTDHIRSVQDELRITGVVTDTPVIRDASISAGAPNTGGDSKDRAASAYRWLLDVKDRAKLVTITTKLRDYRNMALVSMAVTRDAGSSRILNADLSFREIFIAITEKVDAPIPTAAAAPARNKKRPQGKKAKRSETQANQDKAKTTQQSVLVSGAKSLGLIE